MDPAEIDGYVRGWKKREQARKKKREKLARKAMEKAKQIACVLKNEYQIEEIILFGSLAENTFREESDIDLALVNSDKKQYWDMYNKACDIASPFDLDLLPFQEASATTKKRILEKGVKL